MYRAVRPPPKLCSTASCCCKRRSVEQARSNDKRALSAPPREPRVLGGTSAAIRTFTLANTGGSHAVFIGFVSSRRCNRRRRACIRLRQWRVDNENRHEGNQDTFDAG